MHILESIFRLSLPIKPTSPRARIIIRCNIDRSTLDLHLVHEEPACASASDKGGKIRNTRVQSRRKRDKKISYRWREKKRKAQRGKERKGRRQSNVGRAIYRPPRLLDGIIAWGWSCNRGRNWWRRGSILHPSLLPPRRRPIGGGHVIDACTHVH